MHDNSEFLPDSNNNDNDNNDLVENNAHKHTESLVLPGIISDEDKNQLFKELTIILTRSWEENGKRLYGCSETELLLTTQFDRGTLIELLNEYKQFITVLGLELVKYEVNEKLYYCLRSQYYAPPELNESELIVLGIVIALIEGGNTVTTQKIKEKLVSTKRLTNYQVEESLRRLSRLGYIANRGRKWQYNYRLIIEFGEEERLKIAQEFREL